MKVNLKIFLPMLSEVIGSKELEVEFDGETMNDLINHLITRYGNSAKQVLWDANGELDPMIQVLRNGEEWIARDKLDAGLANGDDVVLMMIMTGG